MFSWVGASKWLPIATLSIDTHSGVAENLQLIVDNRLKQDFFWIQCLDFSGQFSSFIDYPGYAIGMCFVQELSGKTLSCLHVS